MTVLPDHLTALSDDYVLGLLSESETMLFEEVMQRDPAVAAYVGDLRDRLLPLDLSASVQDLPAGFADAVQDRLGAVKQLPAAPRSHPKPANDPHRPRAWRGALAASIVALAIGFGAGWQRPLPDPVVVAVLVDDAGVPQAVVEDYGNDTATVRFVADIDVPADRSLQAWTLPSAELGATSLGVLDGARSTVLDFGDLPDPEAQQLYEVTLEPLGGSPTGRPTGPIIGKGFAALQDS
ncbi:anti-sigma factor [Loktanella sp. SALINAS62]|uniref:anti-sigma factor n=1 Tax=Loktanella sp. SALINAS62 TaxID=2706124 RepID=UPI001B8CC3B4|nr:anti-sigma factor [Loktanella sp. SALINAS62]MBS1301142.1 anti-sigma factor [Loktanella sp. SALINAS62]